MHRLAKIVATVGPASAEEQTLLQLLREGVDVVRLNLSHGDRDSHREVLRRVRRLSQEEGRFVPVLADLMGPRFRLGEIAEGPILLEEGTEVLLGKAGPGVELPVEDPDFIEHLEVGERILVDNGLLELEILSKDGTTITARVMHGGHVSTRKGINLPDTDLPFTISKKDRLDIAFAIEEGADFLGVSFVGSVRDLEAIRATAAEFGACPPLVAKLERAQAMAHLEAIVESTDAVMVARGDLGVEVPLHQVPVLQKRIIETGRRHGKSVIVATQMLESMMTQPRPTRAEASDCANAVFDGADALMLSGETAAGQFPVEAVQTMARVIQEAESFRRGRPRTLSSDLDGGYGPLVPNATEVAQLNPQRDRNLQIPEVVASAAVLTANRLGARQIVAFSQGGFTARMIARYRPRTPILIFTRSREVARRVQLLWGARPLLMEHAVDHHDEVVSVVDGLLLANGLAEAGETIVILMGDPIAERPLTNLMRVHRVRAST